MVKEGEASIDLWNTIAMTLEECHVKSTRNLLKGVYEKVEDRWTQRKRYFKAVPLGALFSLPKPLRIKREDKINIVIDFCKSL